MTQRCTRLLPAGEAHPVPVDIVVLAHDQRHLRRKLLHLQHGDMVMLDLKEAVMLAHGDLLALDDGNVVEVVAAEETIYDIRGRDRLHLIELAWHLGNRHLPAQIEDERIVILKDPVIRTMLEGLGAAVAEAREPFHPVRGAYHQAGGGHGHAHGHDHAHDHSHGHGHHHHD